MVVDIEKNLRKGCVQQNTEALAVRTVDADGDAVCLDPIFSQEEGRISNKAAAVARDGVLIVTDHIEALCPQHPGQADLGSDAVAVRANMAEDSQPPAWQCGDGGAKLARFFNKIRTHKRVGIRLQVGGCRAAAHPQARAHPTAH